MLREQVFLHTGILPRVHCDCNASGTYLAAQLSGHAYGQQCRKCFQAKFPQMLSVTDISVARLKIMDMFGSVIAHVIIITSIIMRI